MTTPETPSCSYCTLQPNNACGLAAQLDILTGSLGGHRTGPEILIMVMHSIHTASAVLERKECACSGQVVTAIKRLKITASYYLNDTIILESATEDGSTMRKF